MRRLVTFILLALLSGPVWAQQHKTTCSYSDKARKIALVKKPCTLEQAEINNHFAWIIRFSNGPKVTVEYVTGGPDHVWKINGKPGWGHEIDREDLHGATNDKTQTIAWFEPD
jgi:hypothetical protein